MSSSSTIVERYCQRARLQRDLKERGQGSRLFFRSPVERKRHREDVPRSRRSAAMVHG